MRKFLFFVVLLGFCFGSLAYLATTGQGRNGLLKPWAGYLMHG